jgi:hypothetical protein
MIVTSFIKLILATCSKIVKTEDQYFMITKTISGSTIVSGIVSTESSAVDNMNTVLQSSISAGNQVQGYSFIASSTTVNGLLTDIKSSQLGLILGISIPLFIISKFLLIKFL